MRRDFLSPFFTEIKAFVRNRTNPDDHPYHLGTF